MTDFAAMANTERKALYTELQGLSEQQWSTMTACDPWTVRQVVAHLTALGNQTVPNFFSGFVRSGFNFNKFIARDLAKFDRGSNEDILAGFARTVDAPRSPPAPKYVPLGEYLCHGEDIRRALGRPGEHPAEHLIALADGYQGAGKPLGGKKRIQGLRLRATDVKWSTGEGPEVAGPCMDLILAMTGRGAALATCEGNGVATLRARC